MKAEGYDAGALPTDISATRLRDSPRVTRLFKEHASQIQPDYLKRGFAKLGEAWHSYMERHAPDGWITERRFYAQVEGKIVSGAIDAIEPTDTGFKIWDYKLMTAWKAQTDLKEFEKQLNIYAFLLRQSGLNVEGLYISAVFGTGQTGRWVPEIILTLCSLCLNSHFGLLKRRQITFEIE